MSNGRETERELVERCLQNDKERAEREIAALSFDKLDQAIANGLENGRKRSVQGRRKRWSIGLGLSAVCMLLLLTAFVRVSPAFAAIMKEIPGLAGFVERIESDRSLMTAVNNDFIQPVQKSVERNGKKLTVEGIIADEGRLVILYSKEGPGIKGASGMDQFKLLDGDGNEVQAGIFSWSSPGDDNGTEDEADHTYIDAVFGEGSKLPESVRFSVKLGQEWLEVAFDIDHKRFEGMREEWQVNQHFAVGEQRFTVKNAIITPLQVKLTIISDARNEKRSNSLINIALVDEKGRRYNNKTAFGELDKEITYHFHSSYFDKPKKLTLIADGLQLSGRHETMVINTETGETIKTPDDRLKLEKVTEKGGSYEISILLDHLNEHEANHGYCIFESRGAFKDASGNTFALLDGRGFEGHTSSENGAGAMFRSYYKIPKENYTQPLTFEVIQYPGYVLETISIPIK